MRIGTSRGENKKLGSNDEEEEQENDSPKEWRWETEQTDEEKEKWGTGMKNDVYRKEKEGMLSF